MTELKNQIKIKILSSRVSEKPYFEITPLAYGFSGNSSNKYRKYRLELNYNNKKYRFTFHDSIYNYNHNIKLNKLDTIYAILMDSSSYEMTQNLQDFTHEFGYEDIKQAKKAYNGCKKSYIALHDIFSSDELEKLQDEFQDY